MKNLIAICLCCLILSGCTTGSVETSVPVSSTVATQPSTAPETGIPETSIPETVTPEHFLTLYAPNEDATGFIYASWEVPEISAEAICAALIKAGVLKEDVEFNSLTVENGQVNLDVNAAFGAQLMSYGTAGEYMMVGSVVNTLLSAFGAQTVFITIDGQIMESGHVIYDFPMEFYE